MCSSNNTYVMYKNVVITKQNKTLKDKEEGKYTIFCTPQTGMSNLNI